MASCGPEVEPRLLWLAFRALHESIQVQSVPWELYLSHHSPKLRHVYVSQSAGGYADIYKYIPLCTFTRDIFQQRLWLNKYTLNKWMEYLLSYWTESFLLFSA